MKHIKVLMLMLFLVHVLVFSYDRLQLVGPIMCKEDCFIFLFFLSPHWA